MILVLQILFEETFHFHSPIARRRNVELVAA